MIKLDTLGRYGDTLDPKRIIREMFGINGAFFDDGDGEGTALPEGLAGTMGDITTVEGLATAHKASNERTFMDFMPEDAKNDPQITKYKTGEDFYKGHKSAVELIGKKGVAQLGENPTPEEVAKYRIDMGIPDKAEGYAFTPPKDLHSSIKITPETDAGFKAFLHKYDIPASKADAIYNDFIGMTSEGAKAQEAAGVEAQTLEKQQLQNEWGVNYEPNLKIAGRLVKRFGGDEAVENFGDLGNKPGVLKFLANLGKTLSEDSFAGVSSLTIDSGGAKARIAQIEADPAFMDEKAPTHDALIAERTKLYGVAYSEE